MTYRVGRTYYSSASALPNVSATGYDAGDAVGAIFSFPPLTLGEPGGLLGNLLLIDKGSGAGAIRVHFFSESASGSPHGTGWGLASADYDKYLGWVDVSANQWTSGLAATSAYLARILDQPLPLWSTPAERGGRTLWGQAQALANYSAYVANGLTIRLGVLQD